MSAPLGSRVFSTESLRDGVAAINNAQSDDAADKSTWVCLVYAVCCDLSRGCKHSVAHVLD
jgi:hypothetical protein